MHTTAVSIPSFQLLSDSRNKTPLHVSSYEKLENSVRVLEDRVSQLNGQLAHESENRLKELAEKERLANRLEKLVELLPGGVIVLNQRGQVVTYNPVAKALLGEPLEGEYWSSVIERCFAPRLDDGHEVSLKDGRRLSVATSSLDPEPGQIILLTDQTETRLLQQRVSHDQRLTAMGKMVASLAHQIRTPLSTAMLYAGHLKNSQLDPTHVPEFAEKLLSRLKNMEKQVSDMLVFSRRDIAITDRSNIEELFEELQLAADQSLMDSSSVMTLDIQTPGLEFLCHRELLSGAILNLVMNSIQAVERNAVIELTAKKVGQQWLEICVSDHGPGIDPAIQHHAMEEFFTTKSNGTGLGLAVVHSVVNGHKGQFWIDSNPGSGTNVFIRLPVCMDEQFEECSSIDMEKLV
ncbi:MAG: PAS domain-containing protein [Proteobacteria bacterium]|nr:PAS domain-containing protein [Pseudomonadota bacterium]